MTGVHRLQHVQGLATPDLADDNAVGPSQRVPYQVANTGLALALDVGGRLSSWTVVLLQLELDRVFDRDDPLVVLGCTTTAR